MVVALTVWYSVVVQSNTRVLLGTGGVVLTFYLIGLVPKCSKYLPTFLTDGNSLIYGLVETKTYMPSLMITIAIGVICFAISIPIFNKKQL
jgi:ABC-2 type transport system permease protein